MKHVGNIVYLLLALTFFTSCQSPTKESTTKESYLNWQAIADKLLERSKLEKGEKVLLVLQPGQFDPLVMLLKAGIEKNGAIYLGTVSVDSLQPESWKTDFTASLSSAADDKLPDLLTVVDLGIMLPGATPNDRVYGGLQKVLQQGKGRTIHFHWQGAYDLNGKLLTTDSAIDVFYEKVLLQTDYSSLALRQNDFDKAMRGSWIQVSTPMGTDIKFQIGERKVTKQDGDASLAHMANATTLIDREVELPAGAIRVAPVEETVEGIITFPDSEWQGKMVRGLQMRFVNGKVVEVKAEENVEAVEQEMKAAGEAGKSFREFALGFNPMLAIPNENPWIPYYGYGAGVVRLSLGDNSELGGKVTGGYVRWNFFVDATVKIGDNLWVEGGKLLQ